MSENKSPTATEKGAVKDAPSPSQIAAQMGGSPPSVEAKEWPKFGRVRSRVGRMVNLHTGVVVDSETEKKIEIDGFARAQLDAGKWELVTD